MDKPKQGKASDRLPWKVTRTRWPCRAGGMCPPLISTPRSLGHSV